MFFRECFQFISVLHPKYETFYEICYCYNFLIVPIFNILVPLFSNMQITKILKLHMNH